VLCGVSGRKEWEGWRETFLSTRLSELLRWYSIDGSCVKCDMEYWLDDTDRELWKYW